MFLWEGRKENEIKEMVKKMTKVFVDMGIPENAVEIIVQACKARWAIGGELEKTFSVSFINRRCPSPALYTHSQFIFKK